jgi:hypothetical protein
MVHPYREYYDGTPVEAMDKISVTLEICTLYNGLPHGIAIIQYKDPEKYYSFRGVGVFDHGELQNAPFTCVAEYGNRYSFSNMQNGRPAEGSFFTEFYRNGAEEEVNRYNLF